MREGQEKYQISKEEQGKSLEQRTESLPEVVKVIDRMTEEGEEDFRNKHRDIMKTFESPFAVEDDERKRLQATIGEDEKKWLRDILEWEQKRKENRSAFLQGEKERIAREIQKKEEEIVEIGRRLEEANELADAAERIVSTAGGDEKFMAMGQARRWFWRVKYIYHEWEQAMRELKNLKYTGLQIAYDESPEVRSGHHRKDE